MNSSPGTSQKRQPDIDYGHLEPLTEDAEFQRNHQTAEAIVEALNSLKRALKEAYPNCAPLRQQLHRIEMSILAIQKSVS